MALQRPTPGHRTPRLAPCPAHTARPTNASSAGRDPLAPRAAQLSRDLTGTSRRTSLFLRDTLASHQPPGPRPQVPLPDGIIFAGALVVRVRRAGRAGAEGRPPQASGRGRGGPGLLCPAGTRSGVHGRWGNGRARPGREQHSAAGLRRARLWAGRRGSPTPPTPPRTAAQQPRAPLLSWRARAPPPRRCPAVAPPPLRRWTADSDGDTLLGELLRPRPHASDLRGAGRCADRDAGSPPSSLSENCSLLPRVLLERQTRNHATSTSKPFDISLSSLCSSTTSDWAMETKYKMNKRDYIKVKKSSARQRKPSTKPKRNLTPGRRYLQTVCRIRG